MKTSRVYRISAPAGPPDRGSSPLNCHYFAYGSNMFFPRLRERVAEARFVGRAVLRGRRLKFDKRGADGTGKANLVRCDSSVVWGGVYVLTVRELLRLDRFEPDYRRRSVVVQTDAGLDIEAETYQSEHLLDPPVAQDWYKELVIAGARSLGLPREYLAYLQLLPQRRGGENR